MSRWRSIAALKAAMIDADAARPQRILGEIERKAVGVVEREGDLALELVALLERSRSPHRGSQGRAPASCGSASPRACSVSVISASARMQLRIGLAHLAHQHRHQPPHQRLLGAEQLGVAHGAAHDAAQHIAAALVRGQHAVGDQERGGAQMVGDDPVRDAFCGPSASTPVRSAIARISARNRSMS